MAPRPRSAIVLVSVGASGCERRMAFVFAHLHRREPGRFHLIINRELHDALQQARLGLDRFPHVHILGRRAWADIKHGAHSGALVNAGRLLTLLKYRWAVAHLVRRHDIEAVQVFLEMVPVLGLLPLQGVPMIASLVSHLPQYYERRRAHCRLLLRALRSYDRVDALSGWIASRLVGLGVDAATISHPHRNCVDHERFHPLPKTRSVTFTGRMFGFKNPGLMVDVAEIIVRDCPGVQIHMLGEGPLAAGLAADVRRRGLDAAVHLGYLPDPSPVVNRSLVHVCIESHDNATNQSLLEGMASGCAIVASDVGTTGSVIRSGVGVVARLDAPELAAAVIRLLKSPDEAARLGAEARRQVLAGHHVEPYLDYLTALHDSIDSDRPRWRGPAPNTEL